ncbi:MAG: hypothetical protein LBQ74_14110 [Prevotella sp.]|jgi:hypothetical protein|nr:hypothetical protein [Prevotella sp.]
MKPELTLPASVTLEDGRVITRKNPTVRDIANAEKQGKNNEHLIKYAIIAAKILIDGKPAVLEDVLDKLKEDDLLKIGEMFVEGEG